MMVGTLFFIFLSVVSQFAYNLENNVMIAIDYFGFVLLADFYSNFFELGPRLEGRYMRLFQLLTRFTADADDSSYNL